VPTATAPDAAPGKPGWKVTAFYAIGLAIFLALTVCLLVAVTGSRSTGNVRPERLTRTLIDMLGVACANYRERFGLGLDYPPMNKGVSQDPRNGDSSKNLVYYLTTPFPRVPSEYEKGLQNLAPSRLSAKGILNLDPSRLSAEGILLDDWGRPILYFNQTGGLPDPFCGPRFPGHDKAYPDPNIRHVDIVSYGPHASGTAPDGTDCKIAPWSPR
jgi:hypothetical protein